MWKITFHLLFLPTLGHGHHGQHKGAWNVRPMPPHCRQAFCSGVDPRTGNSWSIINDSTGMARPGLIKGKGR